jgi:glycosyltransferase involved in cell wall biosynthesis
VTPLNIAMLTTFYPPYNFGGDGIGIRRLATALADRGHNITVIHDIDAYVTQAGREPAPIEMDPRIGVVGLKTKFGLLSNLLVHQLGRPVAHAAQLRDMLAPGKFDVIWYHNSSLVGGPGLFALGDPCAVRIYEAHEHWLICPTHVLWKENRELCEDRACLRCQISYKRPPQLWRGTDTINREAARVDAFIAKSRFSRDKHRAFGFKREMEVVPYFLPDMPPITGQAAPHPRPYFLFVGRLEKIKGVQDIIPAFSGSAADGPDLVIVGGGEYEAALRAQAAGMERVHFTGRLAPEALPAWYSNARALIVPSLCYETFGIILIEAFRGGTPVIARRLGPFPEIVAKGGGLLFEDETTLRAAIAELGMDPARRDALAKEARTAYEENWKEDIVITEYLDVVRNAARAKGNTHVISALEN